MTKLQQRRNEIVDLRQQGLTYREIAERFDISPSRVGQILKRHQRDQERSRKTERFLEEIRRSNDLDKKWPIAEFLDTIGIRLQLKTCLSEYLDRDGTHGISLRELMDMFIPRQERPPRDFFDLLPAYRTKWVGSKTYATIIKRLTRADLGSAFAEGWMARRVQLKQHIYEQGNCSSYFMRHSGLDELPP